MKNISFWEKNWLTDYDYAVIGAGITGITLANLLQKKVKLTVFEKSRGVGGRMATRRAEPYQFNHGTQYFKIENKEFKDYLQPLILFVLVSLF